MIRLMGLVELPPIVEEAEEPTKEPETTDAKEADPSVIAAKLNKLKGMDLNPDQTKKVDEMLAKMETLTAKQQQLDVDKDGEIEADDLEKLRATEVVTEDHEVSMAQSSLDNIIKNATELKEKIGQEEKEIPAWIQDHISVANNNLDQSNTNFHEAESTETPEQPVQESAPEGWEKTVLAMKKHKEIDNPFALAHWMKKKGYHSQKESTDEAISDKLPGKMNAASQQAHQAGLHSVGWGRWANDSGQVVAKTVDGKLQKLGPSNATSKALGLTDPKKDRNPSTKPLGRDVSPAEPRNFKEKIRLAAREKVKQAYKNPEVQKAAKNGTEFNGQQMTNLTGIPEKAFAAGHSALDGSDTKILGLSDVGNASDTIHYNPQTKKYKFVSDRHFSK